MLSSIFLNLFVFTTCFMRWSRFWIFYYGVGYGEDRNNDGAEGDEVIFGDGERVFVVIDLSLVVMFNDFSSFIISFYY